MFGFKNFWSHISRSTTILIYTEFLLDFTSYTQITNKDILPSIDEPILFHRNEISKQDVRWLQISMHDSILMHVGNRLDNLPKYHFSRQKWYWCIEHLQSILKRPSSRQIYNEINLCLILKNLMEINQIGVIEFSHDSNLIFDLCLDNKK